MKLPIHCLFLDKTVLNTRFLLIVTDVYNTFFFFKLSSADSNQIVFSSVSGSFLFPIFSTPDFLFDFDSLSQIRGCLSSAIHTIQLP